MLDAIKKLLCNEGSETILTSSEKAQIQSFAAGNLTLQEAGHVYIAARLRGVRNDNDPHMIFMYETIHTGCEFGDDPDRLAVARAKVLDEMSYRT
jgi:hypothetical protein